MTFSSAGESGQPSGGNGPEVEETSPREEPVDAPAELQDKPVLEWTTDDWARWIEEPSHLPRHEPEPPEGSGVDVDVAAGADPEDAIEVDDDIEVEDDIEVDDDITTAWSQSDEPPGDGTDNRWWSSIAGLADLPDSPTVEEAPGDEVPMPPPVPPDDALFAPLAPPTVSAPPLPTQAPRPTQAPLPTQAPRPTPARRAPAEQDGRPSLEPVGADTTARRVRAGIGLLGVSVLVGTLAAGLITMAIFLAGVVLRNALG